MLGIKKAVLYYVFLIMAFIASPSIQAQEMQSKMVLNNSIKYHDPQGKLQQFPIEMKLNQIRPDGSNRHTTVFVGLHSSLFSTTDHEKDRTTTMENLNGEIKFKVNGNGKLNKETLDKYKLTKERFDKMHNYYRYLWFAPLILKDPGTRVAELANPTYFNGKKVWEIKVTYDPAVGSDIWYFYFDQSSYAMIGYRFYHDESKSDGEYIILEGEVERDGIRIPASRKWYLHQDDKYLGNDQLLDFDLLKS